MEHIRINDWTQHIWKIAKAGAILALIGIFTPPTGIIESDGVLFLWYFGFWFISGGSYTDAGFVDSFWVSPYDMEYLTIGIVAIVLLIIATAAMMAASNKAQKERNFKTTTGASAAGGIFAFVAIGAYYGYLDYEFPAGYWTSYDPSFGFFLPLIGGIFGIIGAIAAGYAYSLEIKGEPIATTAYKPTLDTIATETQNNVPSQIAKPKFCKNCGTKLVGPFCIECGAKAEF